jgi:hypothetical protein
MQILTKAQMKRRRTFWKEARVQQVMNNSSRSRRRELSFGST